MNAPLVCSVLLTLACLHSVAGQASCTDQRRPSSPVELDKFGGRWRRPQSSTTSDRAAPLKTRQKPGKGTSTPAKLVSAVTGDWGCTCVPYHLCRSEQGTEAIDELCDYHGGENMIDVRTYRPPSPSKPCADTLEVCCPPEHVAGNRSAGCPEPGCGQRHPDGVGFCVVGDEHGEAEFGEFPWMAAIAVVRAEGVRFLCGGSLINRKVVLTAAHCIDGLRPSELVVRVGEWDTRSTVEPHPHQDLFVASLAVHEKFATDTLYNDVGLVFLSTPAKHDVHVGPVCLPKVGAVFDKSRCFVSGWGQDVKDRAGTFHPVLKKRDVPVVSRAHCQDALRSTRLGARFKLHASFICAGGEHGSDACTGDGGGPLVCPLLSEPSKWQQAGIVAWGIGCGEEHTPGVYVDVAQFRPWIDRRLADEYISSLSYTP